MMRPGEFGDASIPSRYAGSGEESSGVWAPIARFLNAAEAGYFAHELKLMRNIPVTLRAEDDFDAVSGNWSTGFVLAVPEVWAERAAATKAAAWQLRVALSRARIWVDRGERERARTEVERALAQVEASELEVDVRAARAMLDS